VVVLALVGGLLLIPGSETHTIRGEILLADTAFAKFEELSIEVNADGSCYGTGGYGDMSEGANVVVRNGLGDVIESSQLGQGKSEASNETAAFCRFAFAVEDVPDSTFYAIEIAHRGEVNYSMAEMESRNWKVELSLGGD
jgi:hypothetical protein